MFLSSRITEIFVDSLADQARIVEEKMIVLKRGTCTCCAGVVEGSDFHG